MASNSSIFKPYLDTFKNDQVKLRFKYALKALLTTSDTTSMNTLAYYIDILKQADEVLINKMTEVQKMELKRQLHLAYLLLWQHNDYLKYKDNIQRCEQLIDYIDVNKGEHKSIGALEHEHAFPGRPVAYCGMQAGTWMGERILDVVSNKTTTVIEWMTAINEKRLYWVWGGGLLRTVLALLPDTLYNIQHAKHVASAPNQFTGYMSWTLYYARFALNSFLLIKDTFAPPMTDAELEKGSIDYWERFKTQWNIRKFTLLNDSIWGIANMVCFFWFTGSNGDALTVALLSFDLFIAIWDFEEQKTLYNKNMLDYETESNKLTRELINTQNDAEAKEISLKLKKLEKEKVASVRDFDHKKLGLISNIAYAASLMVAFVLLTMPFLPIPAATLIIIGVIGAILCFALTVIYNAIKGGLEIKNANLSAKEAKMDLKQKITEFNQLMMENENLDEEDKVFLFLDIKQLLAETEYQKQMVLYQTMHLIRNIFIQSLIPALMFVSLVFLPTGIGFAVLAAALALAVVTNLIIEKTCKPVDVKFPEFDNDEYEQFCADPGSWGKKSSKRKLTLFEEHREPSQDEDVPLLENDSPLTF